MVLMGEPQKNSRQTLRSLCWRCFISFWGAYESSCLHQQLGMSTMRYFILNARMHLWVLLLNLLTSLCATEASLKDPLFSLFVSGGGFSPQTGRGWIRFTDCSVCLQRECHITAAAKGCNKKTHLSRQKEMAPLERWFRMDWSVMLTAKRIWLYITCHLVAAFIKSDLPCNIHTP